MEDRYTMILKISKYHETVAKKNTGMWSSSLGNNSYKNVNYARKFDWFNINNIFN